MPRVYSENLELIYQEVREKLRIQIESIDSTGTKINFLLGFNSIIIAALFQTFSGKLNEIGHLLKISIFLFIFSSFLNLICLVIFKYRRDPDPDMLYSKYQYKTQRYTKAALIQSFIDSYSQNTQKIAGQNNVFNLSLVLTFIALLFIFTFVVKNDLIYIGNLLLHLCLK